MNDLPALGSRWRSRPGAHATWRFQVLRHTPAGRVVVKTIAGGGRLAREGRVYTMDPDHFYKKLRPLDGEEQAA
jgi:hypothetical protein